MEHAFFASYARPDDNRSTRLSQVVKDLTERVRGELGARALEGICFFDVSDIQNGQKWETVLAEALRHARVLVCMCSPTYFNSEFCAKEFEVFRLRLAAARQANMNVSAILPILWQITPLPKAMTEYQYADASLPDAYVEHGLRVLRELKGHRDNYLKAVTSLARAITALVRAPDSLPSLVGPIEFDKLSGAFQNPKPGRYNLAVVVLHDRGPAWELTPFGPTVARTIEVVASSLGIGWRALITEITDVSLVQQLEHAKAQHEAVVIITTTGMATAPRWSSHLQSVDGKCLDNCAVVLGIDESAGAEAKLRALCPKLTAATAFHEWFDSAEALRERLERAIERVRQALIKADPPAARVEDAPLAADARRDGVPIDVRPSLRGPGGDG